MRILVTGSSGYLGRKFIEKLVQTPLSSDSLEIIGMDIAAPSMVGYTHFHGDIRYAPDCAKAITEYGPIDVVYHLAAMSNVLDCEKDSAGAFATNVFGTVNMLRFSKMHAVKKFVFASSREVYGNQSLHSGLVSEKTACLPISQYGVSKLAAEVYVNSYAQTMKTLNLRLTNILGWDAKGRVFSTFLNQAYTDETLYVNKATLDFIHIDDATQALARIAESEIPYQVMNICSGRTIDIEGMAYRIVSHLNSKSRIEIMENNPYATNCFVGDNSRCNKYIVHSLSHRPYRCMDNEITKFIQYKEGTHATS